MGIVEFLALALATDALTSVTARPVSMLTLELKFDQVFLSGALAILARMKAIALTDTAFQVAAKTAQTRILLVALPFVSIIFLINGSWFLIETERFL